MNVVFIGIGLMGGSMSLAMKKNNFAKNYQAISRNVTTLKKAVELNLIDSHGTFQELVPNADFIVLATPIDAIINQLPMVLDLIKETAVVIDLGSTKKSIVDSVVNHPKRKNFVAIHPIAGTEYSGPESALADLYENKTCILCDIEKNTPIILNKVKELLHLLKMNLVYMSSSDHDLYLAYVSHLSHIISFSLSNTVLNNKENSKEILNLAGSGFASTVRLAKSSPEMWLPIYLDNKQNIIKAIDGFTTKLLEIKTAIEKNDSKKIVEFLYNGNKIGKILK
ncbi:MAG: prephenate dehydrogenase [Solirubrobacteraceae bacterium]